MATPYSPFNIQVAVENSFTQLKVNVKRDLAEARDTIPTLAYIDVCIARKLQSNEQSSLYLESMIVSLEVYSCLYMYMILSDILMQCIKYSR